MDNFEQFMTQILPALEIASGSKLQFETLDAFHPDVWLEKFRYWKLTEIKTGVRQPEVGVVRAAAKIRAYLPS